MFLFWGARLVVPIIHTYPVVFRLFEDLLALGNVFTGISAVSHCSNNTLGLRKKK